MIFSHRLPTWRTVFPASILTVASLFLAGCTNEPSLGDTSHSEEDFTSRVKAYTSLAELEKDASLAVVGRISGDLRLNPYYGDAETPFAIADFKVREVIFGDSAVGGLVEVSIEAGITSEGNVASDKLSPDHTYLLYLLPQGDQSPSTYTIVGYKAGIYEETADGVFRRIDGESPRLPAEITTDDARRAVP